MPNWCTNYINITGSKQLIEDLWNTAKQNAADNKLNRGLLSAMYPEPVYEQEDQWYNWRVNNWGTKWDVDLEGLELDDTGDGNASILGVIDTAWSPPIEAFKHFAEQHDQDGLHASIEYHEPGMGFVGQWDSVDGDEFYDYSSATSETVKDLIPEDLDETFHISEDMAYYEECDRESDSKE